MQDRTIRVFHPGEDILIQIVWVYFAAMLLRPSTFTGRFSCMEIFQVGIVTQAADDMKTAA